MIAAQPYDLPPQASMVIKKNCTSWSLFCSCCITHHDMGLFISHPPWAPAGNLQDYYLNPIA